MNTDITKTFYSLSFYLQLIGSFCLGAFEVGITNVNDWYVVGMIIYVNMARMYMAIQIPLVAVDDGFEADTLHEILKTLNILNIIYIICIIFLPSIYGWAEISLSFVKPTYLLFLFLISAFAFRSVQVISSKRNEISSEKLREVNENEIYEDEKGKEDNEKLKIENEKLNKEVRKLEKQVRINDKLIEIGDKLGKPILRNGRYCKVVFDKGNLSVLSCDSQGITITKKSKLNGASIVNKV